MLRISEHEAADWPSRGGPILTVLEQRLFALLLEREGEIVAREALTEVGWEMDVSLTAESVDAHVERLRTKLIAAGRDVEVLAAGFRFRPPRAR